MSSCHWGANFRPYVAAARTCNAMMGFSPLQRCQPASPSRVHGCQRHLGCTSKSRRLHGTQPHRFLVPVEIAVCPCFPTRCLTICHLLLGGRPCAGQPPLAMVAIAMAAMARTCIVGVVHHVPCVDCVVSPTTTALRCIGLLSGSFGKIWMLRAFWHP